MARHQPFITVLALTALSVTSSHGALIISQYYEGASFNKYLELTNTNVNPIDITDHTLTRWSNAATEDWKNSGNSPNSTVDLSGLFGSTTVAGSATIVVANGNHAQFAADFTSGVINFNGDDSMVLYSTATFEPGNIVDVISFTEAGSEGTDTSITRTDAGTGYDTTAGSTFLDFPSIWNEIGQATADNATTGSDDAIGSSDLAGSVPEPAISILGGLGLLGLLRRRR
jgi:predicted extracellular nuclease